MGEVQVIYRKIAKEVSSIGSVTLATGISGSVDSITVDSVEVMSASVPFNSSLTQTAADVAANINAFTSVPNYTAKSFGTKIVIAPTITGSSTNGFVVDATATTITTTDVNLASGGNNTTGVKVQNEEWFGVDIPITCRTDVAPDIELELAISSSVLVQISFDGGTTWIDLVTPAANGYTKTVIPVINGDAIQLRTNDAAGTTVNRCVIGFRGD